jgi:predicted acetyltransferase
MGGGRVAFPPVPGPGLDTPPAARHHGRMAKLVEPSLELYGAFLRMSRDYQSAGEDRYQHEGGWDEESFRVFLSRLRDNALGRSLPPGYSPTVTHWLLDEAGEIVGASRLRPVLTEELMHEGGNIGYDVPPSARLQGNGTALLRLTLAKAAERGLTRALLTCDKDNEGSRKIIERNGGVLDGEGISDESGKPVLRFWITMDRA